MDQRTNKGRGIENKVFQRTFNVVSWISPSSWNSLFSPPALTGTWFAKRFLMTSIPKRDKRNGFIAVTAGFSLIMVAFAIKQIFRSITFRNTLRKAPAVDYPGFNGESSKRAGAATSTAPESVVDSGDITHNTSPIELSEDSARVTMLLSEAVLRKDWDSPEDNEAWRNL
jgi:hypothetical protein